MDHQEKQNLYASYISKGMDASSSFKRYDSDTSTSISIKANESGIVTIPMPVLENMFSEANNIIIDKCVVALPKSDGKTHIVDCGARSFKVIAGKGGALVCQRECPHKSTKLCSHIIAVGHVTGKLHHLINWFKGLKSKGASITALALSGAAPGVGSKRGRKRSNAVKPTPTTYVDMLNDNFPNVISPVFSPPVTQFAQSRDNSIQLTPTEPFQQSCHGPSQQIFPGSSPPMVPSQQENSFCLKWLYGTTVSKCYGCNECIQNPPTSSNEALIVVYRDKRWYYLNGQWNLSGKEENVHFHLRRQCIQMRYPQFLPNSFKCFSQKHHNERVWYLVRLRW